MVPNARPPNPLSPPDPFAPMNRDILPIDAIEPAPESRQESKTPPYARREGVRCVVETVLERLKSATSDE